MPFLVTLHVKLNQPSGYTYRPGDLVSGIVWLRSDVDEDVKNLSIVLKGWTTVRFIEFRGQAGPRKFREDYNLFVIPGFLFQGPQKLKKFDVHEWPFEFVFPELSELDFEHAQLAEEGARFQLSPHPLPPSLPFDQANCGGIIYELEATLQNTGKEGKVRSRAENLTFRPRDDGFTDTDHVEHREFKFISRRIPPRSAGQKVRGFFVWDESNRPLTTGFMVHVDVPHDIFLGQLIPVSIQLQRNNESTMEAIPSFSLHTAKIYLITTTATRLLNLEKVPKGHRSREARKSKFLDGGHDMMLELKLGASLDLRRILKAKIEDELLPFSSYSIARSYHLKIALVVKCEGDRTEFTMDVEVPISIFPSITRVQSNGEMEYVSSADEVTRRLSESILVPQAQTAVAEGTDEELPGYAP
jgi:hypothetical protein